MIVETHLQEMDKLMPKKGKGKKKKSKAILYK